MTPRTRTVELADLVIGLPERERRGSRPRCVLLTHGTVQRVADRLTALASPALVINAGDTWSPRGFRDAREVPLTGCSEALLGKREQQELARWWLATTGKMPTWDLVASGKAGARKGLLLVEAKAHESELCSLPRAKISTTNELTITRALREATDALEAVMPGWDLRHAPYQLANRIAWAWKLASMGIPVVLVYLGFLHATEMSDRGAWFINHAGWEDAVRRYSSTGVPADAWGKRLEVGGAWLQLAIRTAHVPLPLPCSICGGQLRWILYGLPTDEAAAAAGDRGSNDPPTHECEQCGAPARNAQRGRDPELNTQAPSAARPWVGR